MNTVLQPVKREPTASFLISSPNFNSWLPQTLVFSFLHKKKVSLAQNKIPFTSKIFIFPDLWPVPFNSIATLITV